ncbi:MAG TPA: hypothetical protein ENH67_05760 [Pseudoalteromonas sp.]|uniref:Uncharacterized protein n=1 Tax=marine sediment metagenome TaxID=412755 RepID=A0A0F9RXI0_9ZZZZ|nr:hypothetical protein [Pseudoalteromonas sp.]HDY92157.1 hypothetical protein [Pseudoalteromonas sp.]HDZ32376.1 hypothetical protein [Pseudoalteromonas sp.]
MAISFALYSGQSVCSELSDLNVFDEQYPKAIYFRNVENSAANTSISYEKWAKRWSKLDGMVVKALDEEIPGRSKEAQKKFIQYKKDNPSKLMLLHFNGNARDPNFDFDAFHAEDWTYFVGTYSTKSTTSLDTNITVNDTHMFKSSDDIAMVPIDRNGDLDWKNAEQVKLLSIKSKNTIIVERGIFNTRPSAYKKGKVYLAPHVSQPPLAPGSKQALWRYNFTNTAQGGMPQRLSKNLLQYLSKGKALNSFDGVEFDVLADIRGLRHPSRTTPIDYNFDGKASQLDQVAQQRYRQGVKLFLNSLRRGLGDNKLILADGNEANQQREISILNGIESETWPSHWDPLVEQWSSGINRHLFWQSRSYSPSLNYIKLGKVPNKKGPAVAPAENLRRLRMAGALFTDTIIAPAYRPRGKGIDNWPEFIGGEKNYNTWLGKPLSNIQFLRTERKSKVGYSLGSNSNIVKSSEKIWSIKKRKNKIKEVINLQLERSGDIIITAQISAKSLTLKSKESRVSYVQFELNDNSKQKNMTWSDEQQFYSRFYFKELKKGSNSLTLTSDAGFIELSDLKFQYGVEIPYRIFENGIVIANPSREDISIISDKISAKALMPLGSMQHVEKLTIKAKDALFLKFNH